MSRVEKAWHAGFTITGAESLIIPSQIRVADTDIYGILFTRRGGKGLCMTQDDFLSAKDRRAIEGKKYEVHTIKPKSSPYISLFEKNGPYHASFSDNDWMVISHASDTIIVEMKTTPAFPHNKWYVGILLPSRDDVKVDLLAPPLAFVKRGDERSKRIMIAFTAGIFDDESGYTETLPIPNTQGETFKGIGKNTFKGIVVLPGLTRNPDPEDMRGPRLNRKSNALKTFSRIANEYLPAKYNVPRAVSWIKENWDKYSGKTVEQNSKQYKPEKCSDIFTDGHKPGKDVMPMGVAIDPSLATECLNAGYVENDNVVNPCKIEARWVTHQRQPQFSSKRFPNKLYSCVVDKERIKGNPNVYRATHPMWTIPTFPAPPQSSVFVRYAEMRLVKNSHTVTLTNRRNLEGIKESINDIESYLRNKDYMAVLSVGYTSYNIDTTSVTKTGDELSFMVSPKMHMDRETGIYPIKFQFK
jgi:hypothetical protein